MNKINALIKERGGFTLIELIIFSAIFSLVSIIFVAMLVSITSVQLRQTASSEVNRQSQFVLNTIQRYIEQSSLIETEATSTPLNSIVLRLPTGSAGTSSRAQIYWESSTDPGNAYSSIFLKIGGSAPEAITSNKVKVEDLTFTKYSRAGAHDSVSFVMALSYNAPSSTAKKFFQRLATTVTRVSAATFDTDILPFSDQPVYGFSLGNAGAMWRSINEVIHFPFVNGNYTNNVYFNNSGNVGIGTTNPTSKLHVAGDTYLGGYLTVSKGTKFGENADGCSANERGLIRFAQGIAGASDEVQVCIFDKDNGYEWQKMMTTSTAMLP